MKTNTISFTVIAVIMMAGLGRADFKYTETTKLTGGMMAGMMKFAGAFNKQAAQPAATTHYLKGNRMRTEHSDGNAQIVDLDGRRFIHVNTQQRTYTVLTFDQMKAALEKMQTSMNQQGMKMTPKFEVTPTGNTKVILGETTREVKVRIDMQVQAQDPKRPQAQNMSFTTTSDMWIAPSIAGYREFQEFGQRMSKELGWMPGPTMGGNPQMGEAMQELRKHAAEMKGLPLLQLITIGMAGMQLPPEPTRPQAETRPQPQAETSPSTTATPEVKPSEAGTPEVRPSRTATPEVVPTSIPRPSEMLTKGLGGMLGGFGRKKKKQEPPPQQPPQPAAAPAPAPAPAQREAPAMAGSSSGVLSEMTTEVTAFSTNSLDRALFEIPAGYREVQQDPEKMFGGPRR